MDARVVRLLHVDSIWILLCVGLSIKSVSTDGHWSIDVQLLNYTNPHGVYYDATENSPCCCQTLQQQPACNLHANTLSCGYTMPLPLPPQVGTVFKDCGSLFTFCIGGECINYPPQEFVTASVIFHVESDNITVSSTLSHHGIFKKNTVQFSVTVNSPNISPNQPTHFIDNFTIPLNLVRTDTYTSPISTTGTYNIATIAIAYLSYCSINYYGNDCSVYCLESNSDNTGYYTCDNNGGKVCKEGYTNINNDCKDKQQAISISTTTHTIYSTITSTLSCFIASDSLPNQTKPGTVMSTKTITTTTTTTTTTKVYPDCSTSSRVYTIATPTPDQATATVQNEQVQNKTSSSCTSENAGLAIVVTLLILTYCGLLIIVIVKIVICLKSSDKNFMEALTTNQMLVNPNYDSGENKNIKEKSQSYKLPAIPCPYENPVDEAIYAPLITKPPPAPVRILQDSQYDTIDSQDSASYAVIDN